MIKYLIIIGIFVNVNLLGQPSTDSISTSLGEFVLVSSDSIDPSTGYYDETSTTSDGGTSQYLEINSGARYASPIVPNSAMKVEMMPNPARGIVELNISELNGRAIITVTDLVGQIVYSTSLQVEGARITYLPAQSWASGTYIVSVNGGGGTFVERLVVQ